MVIDLSDRKGMFYWQVDRQLTPQQIKNIFLDRRNIFDSDSAKKAISYAMIKYGLSPKQSQVVEIGKPIAYGSINNAVPARLVDGTELIIRIHPSSVINGYFWVEKLASEYAIKAGVPSYKTYFIYDERRDFEFDFMVMEKLPGKTMQTFWPISPNIDATLMWETGHYMAKMHKIRLDGFGFFINRIAKTENKLKGQYDTFAEHIYASFNDNLQSLVEFDTVSPTQSKRIIELFGKNEDLLKTEQATLVHNDIADWNELAEDGHITGFIDWDECIAGDPVMDFAQWSLFFDEKRLTHMIEGYKSISPLPDAFKEKLHLFKVRYLISKMVLRLRRLTVQPENDVLKKVIKRGYDVMKDEFRYFKI